MVFYSAIRNVGFARKHGFELLLKPEKHSRPNMVRKRVRAKGQVRRMPQRATFWSVPALGSSAAWLGPRRAFADTGGKRAKVISEAVLAVRLAYHVDP